MCTMLREQTLAHAGPQNLPMAMQGENRERSEALTGWTQRLRAQQPALSSMGTVVGNAP